MSGFSTGCSEWRIIERSLSLCLISERCNEEYCCHCLGEGYPLEEDKITYGGEKQKEQRNREKKRKMGVHNKGKELTVQ